MNRILILTAGYGEGHNAAARNLAVAVDDLAGPGTAQIADLFALCSPRLNSIARRGYLAMINRTPRVWSAFYGWIDRAKPFPRHLGFFRREQAKLLDLLESEKPAAVCCTYPIYAFLMEQITARTGLRVPVFNIVTDSISINSLWWLPRCDGWFLPNHETTAVITKAGCAPSLLHTSGFPVQSVFSARHDQLAPPNLAAGHNPRVLYIINSGSWHAETTAQLLLAENGWEITCAVGRDERLRRKLEHLAARRRVPAHILGWTDQIPQLLMTHHVVISKAGGATTQEAIAARCPMIVNQIVPGQEEGNYELLRRHDIGAYAANPAEVMAALRRGFTNGGDVWRAWRRKLEALARPDAARDIAQSVLHQISHPAYIKAAPSAPLYRHG
jgi:processive 1,2-diacylglycerol beta-glucosyltransferase